MANNMTSSLKTVTHSVPQGSILRPFLFLIYINDISNCIDPFCLNRLFADVMIKLMHSFLDILLKTVKIPVHPLQVLNLVNQKDYECETKCNTDILVVVNRLRDTVNFMCLTREEVSRAVCQSKTPPHRAKYTVPSLFMS